MRKNAVWAAYPVAVWMLFWLATSAAGQMPPPASVKVGLVQERRLSTGHTFVGTVMPLRSSTVGSPVEGRVIELAVDEGDAVKKGQKLAQLRTRQLEIQLAAAGAELSLRKQELAELENGSRPEEIQQAHAQMSAARALSEFTNLRLKRTRTLFARNAASEDQLQEDASAAEGAAQAYLEKKAAWELAVAGPRKEKIEQARARVLAQQEGIKRIEDDIAEHTIVAPFDGHVTREHTEVGQWIAKGDPVVEVVELEWIDIEVPVLESYVSRLRVGASARVTMAAFPGRDFSGRVELIVPQADVRSRSFPVKVRLKNRPSPSGLLFKPGMFARVTLPVGSQQKVLVVPKDAVVLGERSACIYVVAPMPKQPPSKEKSPKDGPAGVPAPDGVSRRVPVELGAAADGWIEVRGPLAPGDRVVVEGNERLFPGTPVAIVNKDQQGARQEPRPPARQEPRPPKKPSK